METLYKTIHYSSCYIYLYKIINSRNLFSCYFLYNIPWIHHWLLFIQIFSPSNNNTCSASAQKKSNLSGECGDIQINLLHLICYGTCFALKVNNRKHELWCLDWVVSTKIGENQLYISWWHDMTHDTRDTGDVTSISTDMTPPPAGRGLLLHQTSGGNTVQISRLSSR